MVSRVPFNPQPLRELFGDDPELIREILEAYDLDLTQRGAELSTAVDTRDRMTLRRIAHSLKGASASVGAKDFADECATMERDAQTAPWPTLGTACQALAQHAAELSIAVRDLITKL